MFLEECLTLFAKTHVFAFCRGAGGKFLFLQKLWGGANDFAIKMRGRFLRETHLIQHKPIFLAVEDAFLFQFTDLGRKPAAVDLEVVGKLLAVKGDFKATAVGFFCLYGEVGHQLFARGALGGDLHALMKENGLGGKILH